MTLDQVQVGNL